MHVPRFVRASKAVRLAMMAVVCALLVSASIAPLTFAGTMAPTDQPTASPDGTTPPQPTVSPDALPPPGAAPPAARYYGAVTLQGQPASAGTTVMAMSSSGATCGTVNVGDPPANGSNYALDDTGSDPSCSTPGSELTFMVGGASATPSTDPAVPDVSGAVHVDLSVP